VVKTVVIDAADPFTSAASLRAVDLSSWITVGTHTVKVAYDGALSVPASIVVKRWTHQKVESFGLKIERLLSATDAAAGSQVTETLTLTSDVDRPEVLVEIPAAAGLDPDVHALEALVKSKAIVGWRQGASLVVSLQGVKAGTTTLKVPYFAARRGSFALPPVRALAPLSSAEGWSDASSVAVK